MEGWERIKFIMEKEGYNKNSFSYAIGMTNNVTITRLINEKRKPSPNTCAKIAQRFPQYNPEWILNGTGNMYRTDLNTHIKETKTETESIGNQPTARNDVRQIENALFMNVPLIHVRAQCGYLNGYGDKEYIESLPTLPVIVDKTYHGNYRLFEAEGDSMDDGSRNSICDGDIVLGREVQRPLWQYKLHINDWYFIIVHRTEGISMFQDYKVRLDEVAELFNLIKIVDRSARL